MEHVRVRAGDVSPERLDTGFYSRAYFEAQAAIEASGLPTQTIGSVCEPWQFGAYALCSAIVWSDRVDGVPYIKAEALGAMLLEDAGLSFVTRETHELLVKSRVTSGDVVVSTSGTIGLCSVVPAHIAQANSNQDTIKFSPASAGYDPYFVATWLSSRAGQVLLKREAGGAVQQHVYLYNFRRVPLLALSFAAQKYIGDKVRQAERLRERAKDQHTVLMRLLDIPGLAAVRSEVDSRTNRVSTADLTARLDAKYYGAKALRTLRVISADGIALGTLVEEISNGFESRTFVESGTRYVTVGDVSSGRLTLENAPMIPPSIDVPERARIDSNCALVVRTGVGIGTAVKVFDEDQGASISSHLIRLKCANEELAAVLGAFLNSEVGLTLQQRMSYGAAQPQIGQEELLAVPVPRLLVTRGAAILAALKIQDAALRAATRLTRAAIALVESLIDSRIAESELVRAQALLEAGVRGADSTLMTRWFPDVDALYALLDADDA